MSAAHTPGPWKFYDDSNDGKTNRIEIVAIGKTVARIYHSVPEEDLPNARLIAAAPELLEALAYALKDMEQVQEVACNRLSISIGLARAAIAKATGEAA